MSFKVIETQEEFDVAIKERIKRAQEEAEKRVKEEFADYEELKKNEASHKATIEKLETNINTLNSEKTSSEQQIKKLTAESQQKELALLKTKVAIENGLPVDLADRLVGEDKDSLTKDATKMAEMFSKNSNIPPLKSTENHRQGDNEEYVKLLQKLELQGE